MDTGNDRGFVGRISSSLSYMNPAMLSETWCDQNWLHWQTAVGATMVWNIRLHRPFRSK